MERSEARAWFARWEAQQSGIIGVREERFRVMLDVLAATNDPDDDFTLQEFAASEIFDQGLFNQGLNYLLDDGLKLFGIVSWATYFIRTSAQAINASPLPTRLPEPALAGVADD